MPIYEYICQKCGERLEELQKINDKELVDCPFCKSPSLKKLVSAAGFKLKGTGWYQTDFKNSGTKKSCNEKSTEPKCCGNCACKKDKAKE
ncbi:MAG: zinc ribbon domain-containing protein [Gammaproteobacteria bacterium]|nr:zinc ribbon domain-containing protein [Gammaproteobacteria bacterium]